MLRGEIEEGDLIAGGFGGGSRRQQLAHGVVEFDLALLDELRKDEAGERLGDGTDFKDRVRLGRAITEDAANPVFDDADGDACTGTRSELAAL